jgi:hypothetical protein
MSKPDWKDAPEWANFLAQDEDHAWCWFENEPNRMRGSWSPNDGRYKDTYAKDWQETLERRP